MTPEEVALYSSKINSYKYYILDGYTTYSINVCNELQQSLNRKFTEQLLLNLVLLELYVTIALDYVAPTVTNDTNFMTFDQFKEIERHINRIMNTNYILDIN